MKSVEEAKKAFHEIIERCNDDQEQMHIEFDNILLECVHPEVKEEYLRLKEIVGGFWYA